MEKRLIILTMYIFYQITSLLEIYNKRISLMVSSTY